MPTIRNIPYFKQSTDYTCGPASLRMVFAFFNKNENEKNISIVAKTEKLYGTCRIHIVQTARDFGFRVHTDSRSSISKIEKFLVKDFPVIVRYHDQEEDEAHYAVVYGRKNGYLYLRDPWFGPNFRISEKEFLTRWRSKKDPKSHWMMVCMVLK